jgi:hypothetical protein
LKVWHERFGHLREHNFKLLVQKNLFICMDIRIDQQLDFCIGFVNDKQCKDSFQKGDPKKMLKTLLELLHTYLCGPMKMTSMGWTWLFMTFTNNNTKMVWTHFLKQRLEALASFKEFQATMETSSWKKIKSIWSDNGGEFNAC